jgi:hypothetical protein
MTNGIWSRARDRGDRNPRIRPDRARRSPIRPPRETGKGNGEEEGTVAILVEEAEGLLELRDLLIGELVRHGRREGGATARTVEARHGEREKSGGLGPFHTAADGCGRFCSQGRIAGAAVFVSGSPPLSFPRLCISFPLLFILLFSFL